MVIVLVMIIFPFAIIIFNSLKTEKQFLLNATSFPTTFNFSNYVEVFRVAEIPRSFMNSILLTTFSLFGQILIGSLAAYALTKMNFKRSNLFLSLFLIPIIFSIHMVVLPVFIIFKYLNLLDTYLGAILIYIGTGLSISIFILTGFMRKIPNELIEAALMDGATHYKIYTKVILPLIKTPIAAICIVNGLAIWNDFFVPLMFFTKGNIKTIPLGIFKFVTTHASKWTLISADIVISVVPFVILYLFLQRFFIEGITTGSLKG
jgi:raffinose/stachyose/melibiose transport system permease protein